MVGALSNGKNMRGHLIPPLATVDANSPHGVDGEPLVGVDSNTEETRVGVDELIDIADPKVPQNRGIIEIGQVAHVLTAVKLGRVDLSNLVFLEDFFLENCNSIMNLTSIINTSPL